MADALPTAPRLPDALEFLGGIRPPEFGGGRVAIVLFWSATSVHSERALATLAWLDVHTAGRACDVVSIHVPRDARERGVAFVQRARARFGIRHPVGVDDDAIAFAAFGARSLPSLAIVDGAGALRFVGGGEPDPVRVGAAVDALLDEAAQVGAPSRPGTAAAWFPPAARLTPTELRFPSGIAVDHDAGLLWIADTGRHRVLAVGLADGMLRHVVGSGLPGGTDGDFGFAAFDGPRGLAAADQRCYVADAGNHCVRCIDLRTFEVSTVLGQHRHVPDIAGGLAGPSQGIASPWDVELAGEDLYVAVTGTHQVWQVTLGDGYAYAWSGVGHAGLADGMRHSAAFAQPAGLAFDGNELAIVDADNGAVRIAGIATQHVHTVVGSPGRPRLFGARGIAWHRGTPLVADTLGDRVVRVASRDGTLSEVLGSAAGLDGPEALAVDGDRLWVADVGNHRVVCVDLATGASAPLEIVDPHPDHPEPETAPLRLRADAFVSLCFPMPTPADERLHPEALGLARIRSGDGEVVVGTFEGVVDPQGAWGTVRNVPTAAPGDGVVEIVIRYATCHELEDEPHIQEIGGRFRVELTADGADVTDLPLG